MAQTQVEYFAAILKKLIEAEIEVVKDNLASGLGVKDMSEYSRQVGIIVGMKTAIDILPDVFKVLESR